MCVCESVCVCVCGLLRVERASVLSAIFVCLSVHPYPKGEAWPTDNTTLSFSPSSLSGWCLSLSLPLSLPLSFLPLYYFPPSLFISNISPSVPASLSIPSVPPSLSLSSLYIISPSTVLLYLSLSLSLPLSLYPPFLSLPPSLSPPACYDKI